MWRSCVDFCVAVPDWKLVVLSGFFCCTETRLVCCLTEAFISQNEREDLLFVPQVSRGQLEVCLNL